MEKTIEITYNINNPGKKDRKVAQAIAEELKHISEALGEPIGTVTVNCVQSGKKPMAMPTFDELTELQQTLGIGEITINKKFSNMESSDEEACGESRTPHEIVEDLKHVHDMFGDELVDIEGDSECDASALGGIYTDFENLLDELEDAIDED